MRDGFIKVAAGTPKIKAADCAHNAEAIIALMKDAAAQNVKVLCLPELCITGYTCADLFLQDTLHVQVPAAHTAPAPLCHLELTLSCPPRLPACARKYFLLFYARWGCKVHS